MSDAIELNNMTEADKQELLKQLSAESEKPMPTMRHLNIDGVEFDVDMRAVKDIRTVRLIARLEKSGNEDVTAILDLLDFIIGEDAIDDVMKQLEDKDGFVSAERYMDIMTKMFNQLGLKN